MNRRPARGGLRTARVFTATNTTSVPASSEVALFSLDAMEADFSGARSRHDGPLTSHDAAARVSKASDCYAGIVAVLRAHGPLNHDEIDEHYHAAGYPPQQRVPTRLREAERLGMVRRLTATRPTRWGRDAALWEAVDRG